MVRMGWAWILGLGLGLLLGACARGGPSAGSITITMDEYRFDPSSVRVKAGQEVRLILSNRGQEPHELMIGRSLLVHEGRPAGFAQGFLRRHHGAGGAGWETG